MPYFVIENFKAGLDKRRLEAATPSGALITLENGRINRGGEVQKVRAFVPKYDLPNGTFGLYSLNGNLFVFGSGDDPGVPAGISYQKLAHEAGTPMMTAMTNVDAFGGKIFTLADYDNGDRRAFYDGTIVADLLAGSGKFGAGLILGRGLKVFKNKVYLTSGTNFLFSANGAADNWDATDTDTPGAGIIDVSQQVSNEADLNGIGSYQNWLAFFSSRNTHIWITNADPTAYQLNQTLPNIGTRAAKSVTSFGDHDVFFMSDIGERSLRPINASLSAGVTDVGTPIDDLIISVLDTLSDDQVAIIPSVVEPKDGMYFMPINDTIYAFSYYETSKISAWSTLNAGVNFTDFAVSGARLYARAGNTIYLYGGDNNQQFTPDQVIVELPYLDARTLGSWKQWDGIDVILEGTWQMYINTDPNNPDYWIASNFITRNTIGALRAAVHQHSEVFKMKFVHQGEGDARLSKIIVHYQEGKEK